MNLTPYLRLADVKRHDFLAHFRRQVYRTAGVKGVTRCFGRYSHQGESHVQD